MGKTEVRGGKPVTVPVDPQTIAHTLVRDRARSFWVRRRLIQGGSNMTGTICV